MSRAVVCLDMISQRLGGLGNSFAARDCDPSLILSSSGKPTTSFISFKETPSLSFDGNNNRQCHVVLVRILVESLILFSCGIDDSSIKAIPWVFVNNASPSTENVPVCDGKFVIWNHDLSEGLHLICKQELRIIAVHEVGEWQNWLVELDFDGRLNHVVGIRLVLAGQLRPDVLR